MSHPTLPRPAMTGHVIRGGSVAAAVAQIIALSCPSQQAQAQGVPGSSLTVPRYLDQYSPVERDFAIAVATLSSARQTTFFCTEGCTGDLANTTATMVNLVNEAGIRLQGGEGPYNIDFAADDQFDNALRWLAPEELFALAPIATGFVNGQLGTLDSHMENTRSVSRARLFANNVVSPTLKRGYAATAGAGSAGDSFSRLNLFFDVSASFGDRADTTDTGSEDAFDFDGNELSLGVDWRFSDHLVAGGLVGYTDRKVDFDVNKSAADGDIDATGFSLLAFTQWDDLHWYGSLAVGYQKLKYDIQRRIAVIAESEDPSNFSAPDAVAEASPDGSGLLASLNVGVPFQFGGWGTDIFLKAAWQKQSIDGFSEDLTQINSDPSAAGFAFNVGKQDIKSFDTSLGFKVQYVATPSFGVIIPFLRGEFHQQLEDSPQVVDLEFQGLDDPSLTPQQVAALQDAFQFQLRSDRPDKSWISASIGASAVIRGSSRVSDAGRGSGGLQCYLQYSTVFGLANYNNSAISAGLRYEF
jgi:uncharacterized protein YhjY with autotransporter beta-barrel domain